MNDVDALASMARLVPSLSSAILVIVVVLAFLKHERTRDKAFGEMLKDAHETNDKQREQSIEALKEHARAITDSLTSLTRELEHVMEAQTRILEAVHQCGLKG